MNSPGPGTHRSSIADGESTSTEQSSDLRRTPVAVAPGQPDPLRLLVVDDYPDAADSLARLLRAWGHHVQACLTGQEALEAAATYQPDAALVDIMLPGMDGYELARQLRGHPKLVGVTLIAMTGLGDQAYRRLSQEAGFALHLLKPVGYGELQEILAAVVEKKTLPHR